VVDRGLEQHRRMYQAGMAPSFFHVPGVPLLVHTNTLAAESRYISPFWCEPLLGRPVLLEAPRVSCS
jgi:hypothetical protein